MTISITRLARLLSGLKAAITRIVTRARRPEPHPLDETAITEAFAALEHLFSLWRAGTLPSASALRSSPCASPIGSSPGASHISQSPNASPLHAPPPCARAIAPTATPSPRTPATPPPTTPKSKPRRQPAALARPTPSPTPRHRPPAAARHPTLKSILSP